MPCYYPLQAWQRDDNSITFEERGGDVRRALVLPCGRCIGCRLESSRCWAVRCMHEAQMHDFSSFITLTYDDAHLPYRGDLHYPDFKKFCRRMVKRLGKFRFFMAGEYGDLNDRPHYHAIVFGLFFADRKFFKQSPAGFNIYTSDTLSALWPYGHASVGDVSFESAAYVARYVTKKVTGDSAAEHYQRVDELTGEVYSLTPEFSKCSNRPGIGFDWWQKYGKEVLARGNVVMDGVEMKPPRYYAKICKDPKYDWLEFQAQLKYKPEENTESRLITRELVTKSRLALKKRNLK